MGKAVVIGSGIGGIATSIRLACKGFDVTVFESESHPGGKLSEFTSNGYRFDFGPSLFTMPHLVDELFALAGEAPSEYFSYEKLPVACKYWFSDGTILNAYTDKFAFADEVEAKLNVPARTTLDYLDHSGEMNEVTSPIFLESSLHKLSTYLNGKALKALVRLPGYDLNKSMHDANVKRLGNPKLVQLFDRFATYNGSNPYQAPGILNIIPSLEHLDGAYFPHGGMYNITKSLVELAERKGVKFHYDSPVEQIRAERGSATGIVVGNDIIEADVVISNMDVYHAYHKLLPGHKPPTRILNQERSSSALVFYWGIDRTFEELDVHNIFFSSDYRHEFETMFSHGDICDDPTIYINISSKRCADDAPRGGENWFVMINAPYDNGQNWDVIVDRVREQVVNKLSHHLGVDLAKHIVSEDITDPRKIAIQTLSHKGALYGSSSNNMMAAFLRHPNFSSSIRNLYFCGGSVHPGGGIPLCLLSAKIIDKLTD